MCHWKKWFWPGLLTVALLSVLALWWKTDSIEQELHARATSALSEQGQSWAKVEMDGRDATLTGSAPGEDSQEIAEFLTDEAYDVRVVDNQTGLIVAQSPYVLSAKRSGGSLELTGFVPDADIRAKIVASAKEALPSLNIMDKMTLARGAPAGLAAIAGFGLSQLSGLTDGEMSLSDTNLSVKGSAANFSSYNSINTVLGGSLPAGATLAMNGVSAPAVSPYTWSADYNGEQVVLSGYVPSSEAAAANMANAKSALPLATLMDKQTIASGAPSGFAAHSAFAISQLARFSNGKVGLNNTELSVSGVASNASGFTQAKAAVSGSLPNGLTLAAEKIVPSTVTPYTWAATYNGKTTALSGYVPSAAVRAAIVANAKGNQANATIVDNMQIAAGAPVKFENAASFALAQLPRFVSGTVSLNDSRFSVAGAANSFDAYGAAKRAVSGSLPYGLSLASERITAPTASPYAWSADYNGTDVTLSGYVPNEDIRSSVLAATRSSLSGASVVDNMKIAMGAPANFNVAAREAIAILPHFSTGLVSLSDTARTVIGTAKTETDFRGSKSKSRRYADGFTEAKVDITPAPITGDYVWSAERKGNAIILAGSAPTKEARDSMALRAQSLYPGATVVNRIVPRTNAPTGFISNANRAIGLLDRLKTGKASISNQRMSIRGQASSVNNYAAAQRETSGKLRNGYKWDVRDIKPVLMTPYTWSLDKGTKMAVQSGFVPSRGLGDTFAGNAAKMLGKKIDNKQRVAAGAPKNFGNAVAAAISAVKKLDISRASITNTNMFVQGRALTQAHADRISEEIAASMPPNFKVRSQISYPLPKPMVKAVKCDIDFVALFAGEKIHFATDRAVIKPTSYSLLDRVATSANTCPNARFEISGHTDSRGRATYNQQLSEARARAVAAYLSRTGVAAENLIPVGYGEIRPIATNDTVEGRAQNRRIDFSVLAQ